MKMMEQKRKGARSFKDLDRIVIDGLNRGELESVNLTEWLAVDQRILLEIFLRQSERSEYLDSILNELKKLKKESANILNETIGRNLLALSVKSADKDLLPTMSIHLSDTVRCWATYMIGFDERLSVSEELNRILPFAADTHFGVREIAWMVVRSDIIENLQESIGILETWVLSENEYIRRFASESTRPRGVWCAHIEALKQDPGLAIGILQALKSDPSKYVRDSVGNWLNDASKTQPEYVRNVCLQWEEESPTKETAYIVKKALRSLTEEK